MSYDLYLLRVPPGADPLEAARCAQEQEEEQADTNPGPPSPEKEARKRAIADALMAADPELEVFPFDYAEIARFSGISEDEARLRHRHLELNGPENGPGIQIMLFDDTASVTLPYWHDGESARRVWERVWTYLEVLERTGGYVTYDPQQDQVLDLAGGPGVVLATYGGGVRALGAAALESFGEGPPPAAALQRPWWRFWGR